MSPGGVKDLTILATAGIAIAVLAIAGALIAPPPVVDDERGSTFSPGPDGAKAAYLTLKQLGYRIERSIEPVTAVAADPASTALVLASPAEPPSDQDRRAIRRFLEAGGLVLATGRVGAAFLGGQVEDESPVTPSPPTEYSPTVPSSLASGALRITMAPEAESVRFDPAFLIIYGADRAGVVRTSLVCGGRAVWWAGSTPISNDAIASAGNLDLLVNALGPPDGRAILWDEHYHGHARSMWSYAAATPLLWVLAQTGIMAIVALATYSRRRGPVRSKVVDSRTSPMEFVETLGGLYEQARAAHASVGASLVRLRRLLHTASGLPVGSSTDALSRTAAARFGVAEGEVRDVLVRAEEAAANPSLSPAEALVLVTRLQALSTRVTETRATPRSF
jgi:hypothetical protein